jgi:D-lactate dehydrogenase (cytochrome)
MFETQVRTHPGQRWVILDVAVPISAYPALVGHTEQTLARHGATGYMVGHAGDGNLHVTLPFNDEAGYQRAAAVNEGVVLKALELGGTATGEHGVGIGKARYMRREHGPALDVMRAIKHLLDPKGIMNPGKIFPAHDEE